MLGSALSIRAPHPSFVPGGGATPSTSSENDVPSTPPTIVHDVPMAEAIRSPQFHLLGITFTCLATGGMGIFSVAKPMMTEVPQLPSLLFIVRGA